MILLNDQREAISIRATRSPSPVEDPLLLGLPKVELRRKSEQSEQQRLRGAQNDLRLELQHSLLEPRTSRVPLCTFNEFPTMVN